MHPYVIAIRCVSCSVFCFDESHVVFCIFKLYNMLSFAYSNNTTRKCVVRSVFKQYHTKVRCTFCVQTIPLQSALYVLCWNHTTPKCVVRSVFAGHYASCSLPLPFLCVWSMHWIGAIRVAALRCTASTSTGRGNAPNLLAFIVISRYLNWSASLTLAALVSIYVRALCHCKCRNSKV